MSKIGPVSPLTSTELFLCSAAEPFRGPRDRNVLFRSNKRAKMKQRTCAIATNCWSARKRNAVASCDESEWLVGLVRARPD